MIRIYPMKPSVWNTRNHAQSLVTAYCAKMANNVPMVANAKAILFIKSKFWDSSFYYKIDLSYLLKSLVNSNADYWGQT